MKLTKDDAKELAKVFRGISVSLGDYRFNNWDNLSEKEKTSIKGMELTLLNYSNDFITQTVGLILEDATASLTKIKQATEKANKAITKIKMAKKVIEISTSVIGLAAAIITKNPGAMAAALVNVVETIKQSGQ